MPVSLAVAAGGALGAYSRYMLDRLIEQRSFASFPWATFTINVSGCFVIGALVAAIVDRHNTPVWLRLGLTVGVVGGYTTFSTFAQETLGLMTDGEAGTALLYAFGSLAVGVAAVYLGMRIASVL